MDSVKDEPVPSDPFVGHLPPTEWAVIEREAAALVAVWGRSREAFATKVSSIQLQALLTIEQHETINLGRLAAALGAVPSSASRLCDRLEAAGLVRRSHCQEDKRELTLSLTPSGRSLVEELEQRRRADLARVLAEMPPAGRIALLRGLQAFAGAADRIMERQAEEPEDDWTTIAARLLA
ncbi:MarR family winged helix-turn-helix transcriptional regulator [Nonomuraea sp. CA-141351]|uniref:MarR family winged helix-turn-helix transcriptional regulator n=1 Tax=Nonomuraea sp. CA-141351 TaxID=3239996 RepID=UPI003D8FF898